MVAYLCRHHLLLGQRQEQTSSLRHEQGGRNTLTTNVTQGKVELVTLPFFLSRYEQIAIEVATHFLGRSHRCIEVYVLTLWEGMGHHAHLDITGNTQVTLDAFLGSGGFLQLVVSNQQFLVGLLQTSGCNHAEYQEYDQRRNDESYNN